MRKKDFWNECYDRETPERDFRNIFCKHCRNPECALAGWSRDLFSQRVQQQEDLLFNPNRGKSKKPLADFQSMLNKAVRLEIADRRGDWSLPEDLIEIGIGIETSKPVGFVRDIGTHLADIPPDKANVKSTENIEESIAALKKNTDKSNTLKTSSIPTEIGTQETDKNENQGSEHAINDSDQSCKENGRIFADGKNKAEETSKTSKTSKPNQSGKVDPSPYNTPLHWAGIMLDGSAPKESKESKESKEKPKKDPWAVKPKPSFQEPGARIKFQKGKKDGKK